MPEATGVGERLAVAYRDLLSAEARLGEQLSPRGVRIGVSLIDQWPTLQEYLALYARGLYQAGVLVLGGGPDEGSRHTGIPFTGSIEARAALGLSAGGAGASPSAAAFWRAVERAQGACGGAPLEGLFGTVHLAHARPFDVESDAPEVREASAGHVRRLLQETRPQAVVAVGAEALATLGRAVHALALTDLAAAPESTWSAHYPPGTPLLRYPSVDVPCPRPFRVRVVPVPSLAGPLAGPAGETVEALLAYGWA